MMPAVHRQHHPHVYLWTGSELGDRIDLGGDVIAMSYQRQLGQPAGSWSVTLQVRTHGTGTGAGLLRLPELYRRDLLNKPISLGIDYPGGWCFGLVDGVTHGVSADPAGATLTLRGRDLGKALVADNIVRAGLNLIGPEAPLYLDAVAAVLGADSPLYQSFLDILGPERDELPDHAPTFLAAGIADILTWVVKNTPSLRIPVLKAAYGGQGEIGDYVDTSAAITSGYDDQVFNDDMATYQGSVWGFLQGVLDPDLYEIRLETKPMGLTLDDALRARLPPIPHVYLIVRPKPFDEEVCKRLPSGQDYGISWEKLRTFWHGRTHHEIGLDRVLGFQLGRDEGEVYNHYQAIPKHEIIGSPEGISLGLSYPLTDLWSVRTHGLRAHTANLALVGGDVEAAKAADPEYVGELASDVQAHRNRLLNWYWPNPWFEKGSINVLGADEYRVGDPVYLPWREGYLGAGLGMRYYCTGVAFSWSTGPAGVSHYTAQLTLERGHNDALIDAALEIVTTDAPPEAPDFLAKA